MTLRARRFALSLACSLTALAAATSAVAQEAARARPIYEWTDERGVIHYTDDRELVPEPFLASVRVSESSGAGALQRVIERRTPTPLAAPADDLVDGTPEVQWRAEAARLDARIAELEPIAEKCVGDHVSNSPGDGSRKRREERAEAEACAKARVDLANARSERESFSELAHRAGVPPGWVRESE